jgi:hypothetical protein
VNAYVLYQLVTSCGIDSWIWAWDLRAGEKPVFGLSAWDGELRNLPIFVVLT